MAKRKKGMVERLSQNVAEKRDNEQFQRLFESVPIINEQAAPDNSEPLIIDIVDEYKHVADNIRDNNIAARITPANIMNDYFTAYDIAKKTQEYTTGRILDSTNLLMNAAVGGIKAQLSMQINELLFDAYKTAINNASNIMFRLRGNDNACDDTQIVLNAVIDRITDAFNNELVSSTLESYRIQAPSINVYFHNYSIGEEILSKIYDLLGLGYYTHEYKRIRNNDDLRNQYNISKIAYLKFIIPNTLTQFLYNRVYFIIASIALHQTQIKHMMAIMDGECLFAMYHDKVTTIIEHAIKTVLEYKEAGIFCEQDSNCFNDEYDDEW